MNINLKSKIKVVRSESLNGQDGIEELVGQAYRVTGHWKQKGNEDWNSGEIEVMAPMYGGRIHLNKGEYEVITLKEFKSITGVYSYMD